ncbi:unnamed protein product, partial [Tenebrio molitor]
RAQTDKIAFLFISHTSVLIINCDDHVARFFEIFKIFREYNISLCDNVRYIFNTIVKSFEIILLCL